jgi:hypothetical protein
LACPSLTTITVGAQNPDFIVVNGVLFNQNQTTLVLYPSGVRGSYIVPSTVTSIGVAAFCDSYWLTNISIPNSVTSFSFEAFDCCTGLTSVTIPKSVTSIGDYAFLGCFNLTNIYFGGNAPDADSTMFSDVPATAYYLPGTTGWDVFSTNTGIPAVLWNPTFQTTGNIGFRNNQFGFTITGTPNIPIQIAATTSLSSGTWTPLQSCDLTNGSINFSDPNSTNYPSRFYTVQFP